jgi:hypothetical protein
VRAHLIEDVGRQDDDAMGVGSVLRDHGEDVLLGRREERCLAPRDHVTAGEAFHRGTSGCSLVRVPDRNLAPPGPARADCPA